MYPTPQKTTMRYQFIPIKMAIIIIIIIENKCWQECRKIRTFIHHWWECKIVQPCWKAVWQFLKMFSIELPYGPVIPLVGIKWKWSSLCHVQLFATPWTVHWIFQPRILESVAVPLSRGSSLSRDRTHFSCSGRQILYHWATREARKVGSYTYFQSEAWI